MKEKEMHSEHEHCRYHDCRCHEHHNHEHEHEHGGFCHVEHECGCSCCDHDHEHEDEGSEKVKLIRLAAGAVTFGAAFFASGKLEIALCIAAYLILGYDVLINAFKNILKGKIFDENFLMAIATLGALAIREFHEAGGVMLFYQIGEMLQDYAVGKSEKSINEIMDIRPDYAYISKDGERIRKNAADVKKGEIIVVSPGERIPLDGIVTEGSTFLDTSCLTGESTPRKAEKGDEVLGGAVNGSGVIYVQTIRDYSESAASRIIEVMRNSLDRKAKSEKFITAFAKKYTPTVVALASIIAIIPPLFDSMQFAKWVYRALIFLVVSCPCALVVSVPLGFFAGLGAASNKGIVIKGGNTLEKLAGANAAVFDKTGTLTEGVFKVSEIRCTGAKADFLGLCAYAEYYSNHPIAGAIKEAYGEKIDESYISDYVEIPGKGVSVLVSGKKILAGNAKLMQDNGITPPTVDSIGTAVYMAEDGEYLGYLTVADKIRDTDGIEKLKKMGLKTVMLTGDRESAARKVSEIIGIDEFRSELLPEDKVSALEKLSESHSCIFTGDGINDAPVLALADVGIAMGGIGSDAAIEAADAVLMNDDLAKIPTAIKIARHTMKIIKENIVFSIAVKVIIMALTVFGIASMWLAIFADVGVALLAVLNSVRALGIKE